MIRITLNGKKYKGVYSWKDLTLARFQTLASIAMPEGYEDYIIADGKFSTENIDVYINAVSKITDKQINEDFPGYYKKVIGCLSNVPVELLTKEQITDLYEFYFKPFVISLIYNTPVIHFMGQVRDYEPEYPKRFRVGLQTFYLPKSVTILQQDIPLANEPAITYTEASDLFRGMKVTKDDVKRLALFMAIYCRKKGEKYNDRKALERQEIMSRVPMSIVWGVFFYTVRRIKDYTMTIKLFGSLQRSLPEIVSRVRDYKSMVTEDSFTSVPVTGE